MLGEKTHKEIIDYYSAADISILPSLMEATSISGLEAMAASLPLVGTKVGGIPFIIKDGINGYLCEPKNPEDLAKKIELLLASKYEKMGEKSRLIATNNFDWMTIADQTIQAYESIV
jgi:glycosyltransferase involved in cell wall biosynthesis